MACEYIDIHCVLELLNKSKTDGYRHKKYTHTGPFSIPIIACLQTKRNSPTHTVRCGVRPFQPIRIYYEIYPLTNAPLKAVSNRPCISKSHGRSSRRKKKFHRHGERTGWVNRMITASFSHHLASNNFIFLFRRRSDKIEVYQI